MNHPVILVLVSTVLGFVLGVYFHNKVTENSIATKNAIIGFLETERAMLKAKINSKL